MASYNLDLVLIKQALNISEVTFDTDLQARLNAAYNWINNQLARYTTVPLAVVPDIIKEIEADIAAGFFKENKTVPVEGERVQASILRTRGEKNLQAYIDTIYAKKGGGRSSLFRHGKNRVKMSLDNEDPDITQPHYSRDL